MRGIPLHDSALGRALGSRQAGEWGNVEELLKVIAEQVDAGNRLFVRANSKRSAQQPKPLEITRPEPRRPKGHKAAVEAPKKRPATSEELVAFFGGAARFTGTPSSSSGNPVTSSTPDESPTLGG